MKIAIGCDHRGFDLKQIIINKISMLSHEITDFGCFNKESVDYPDIAEKVAKEVSAGNYEQGILICGTGIGMCIAANKIQGIRAALCEDVIAASRARKHNNANVICLRGERSDIDAINDIITSYLSTCFEGGRHDRRIDKIRKLESH